jgi:hypothetical protein
MLQKGQVLLLRIGEQLCRLLHKHLPVLLRGADARLLQLV